MSIVGTFAAINCFKSSKSIPFALYNALSTSDGVKVKESSLCRSFCCCICSQLGFKIIVPSKYMYLSVPYSHSLYTSKETGTLIITGLSSANGDLPIIMLFSTNKYIT